MDSGTTTSPGSQLRARSPEHQSWKHAPSAYVVCTKDRAIDTELQQDTAARCDSVREWQTGHSPFVGRPELVIDLVLGRVSSCDQSAGFSFAAGADPVVLFA
ncbi:alpha/beta fold hydrolase [Streptomyces sp. NPDC056638]|uniref:alpha/beta fold hydrolase n=1 Tax=Streptomyces sp. NPDC056638 TaxID=3345887 RepID=UPI00367DCF7D